MDDSCRYRVNTSIETSPHEPEPVPIDWEQCVIDGCIGVRAPASTVCLRHVTDAEERRRVLTDSSANRDLRGVRIDGPLLAALLQSSTDEVSSDRGRKKVFSNARFDHAVFETPAHLGHIYFQGLCTFGATRFEAPAYFNASEFGTSTNLLFSQTVFAEGASFIDAHFMTGALFAHCEIGAAAFTGVDASGRQILFFRSWFDRLVAEGARATRFALTDCTGDLVAIKDAHFDVLDIYGLELGQGISILNCPAPRCPQGGWRGSGHCRRGLPYRFARCGWTSRRVGRRCLPQLRVQRAR